MDILSMKIFLSLVHISELHKEKLLYTISGSIKIKCHITYFVVFLYEEGIHVCMNNYRILSSCGGLNV